MLFAYKKRNCRDLSYMVNAEGKRLLEGLFFRSGHLYKLNGKERKLYGSLGLKTILDLRTDGEIMKKPDDPIEGADPIHLAILNAETLGITHEKGLKGYRQPPNMPELYASIASNPDCYEKMGEALKAMLSLEDGPRLWHCTAGKDRAGILTSLFLLALGYREEDIISDYCLSDGPNRKKGRLYRNLILIFMWKKDLAKAVYKAMLADREYLISAFNAMKEVAGSIDDYIHKTLGVSEEHIEAFKAKFMVQA